MPGSSKKVFPGGTSNQQQIDMSKQFLNFTNKFDGLRRAVFSAVSGDKFDDALLGLARFVQNSMLEAKDVDKSYLCSDFQFAFHQTMFILCDHALSSTSKVFCRGSRLLDMNSETTGLELTVDPVDEEEKEEEKPSRKEEDNIGQSGDPTDNVIRDVKFGEKRPDKKLYASSIATFGGNQDNDPLVKRVKRLLSPEEK